MARLTAQGLMMLFACYSVTYSSSVWSVGGRESLDRPSARSLPMPEYLREKTPEAFELPTVADDPAPRGADDTPRLWVKEIVVDGNTVLSPEVLSKLVGPYAGRQVSVAELEELRQKVTRIYIDAGYINSGAVIPEHAYDKGVLHLQIVEGLVEDVRIHGQGRLRKGYIRNRLLTEPERPLHLGELQDGCQLLLSDPLIEHMEGRLLPGSSPGSGILDVKVNRARPYHLEHLRRQLPPPVHRRGSIWRDGLGAQPHRARRSP